MENLVILKKKRNYLNFHCQKKFRFRKKIVEKKKKKFKEKYESEPFVLFFLSSYI
jgi:hypothetical protein